MSRLLRTFSRSKIKKDKPGSPNSTVSPVSAEATSPPHELQPTVSATSAAEEGAKPTDMTVESAPATSSLSESDVAVSKSTTDVPSPPWAPLPAAAPPELTSDPPELPCPPGGECTFLSAEKLALICELRCLVAKMHTDPVPGFIELTGDLRLHRFLEGYNSDPTMAAEAYVSMLVWRQRNDMDNVRNALANGPWNDDLHAYEASGAVPHMREVLGHLPLLLNFAYASPPHDPMDSNGSSSTATAGDSSSGSNGNGQSSRKSKSSSNSSGSGSDTTRSPKSGHLVTIEFTGIGDPGTMLDALTLDEYITFEKHNMEHKAILLDRLSREKGCLVKMIAVRDMAGLGYKHVGSKGVTVMTSVLKMMQGAYPEVIENIFIVSAPWVFATLWRLVKPFVAPRTIEKIKIMGAADTAAAHELLCARIGASQLPERFGGTLPDRTCLPRKVLEKDGLVLGPHDGHGAPPPPSSTSSSSSSTVSASATTAPTTKDTDGATGFGAKNATGDSLTSPSLASGSTAGAAAVPGGDRQHEPTGGELETGDDSFGVFNGTASLPEPSFGVFGTGQGANGSDNRGGDASGSGLQSILGPLGVPALARGSNYALAEAMEDRVEVRPGAKHEVMLDVVCEPDASASSNSGASSSEGQTVVVAWTFALVSYLATSDIAFGVAFRPESAPENGSSGDGSSTAKSAGPPVEDVWIGEKPDSNSSADGSSSGGDLGSGASAGGREVVVEQKRTPADPADPVTGEFATSRSGTLVLTWDNTYSLFMAKDVRLRVEVWGKASLNGNSGDGSGGSSSGDGSSSGGGSSKSRSGSGVATIKPSLGARSSSTTASADTASMSERIAQNMAALPSVALPLPTSPVASVPTFFSWKGSDGIGGLGSSTTKGPVDIERAGLRSSSAAASSESVSAAAAPKESSFWGAPTDFAVPDFLRQKQDTASGGSAPETPADGNRPPSPTLWERMTSPTSGES